MNIAEPLIRIEKRLESLDLLVDDVEILKENLNQVAKDLNKVIQCLDNLKEAYTQKKCTTEKSKGKYRQFSNEEFLRLFDLGKFHSIRKIGEPNERLVITSIYAQGDYLYAKLNNSDTGYGPLWFYKECEYFDDDKWKPFGAEE